MLGDNNQNQKKYETQYYSNLRIRNYEAKTAIGISFSAGLMKIAIQKENEQHRYDDLIVASLPPKKATILLHEMNLMEESSQADSKAYGVTLGLSEVQTAIAFQIVNDTKYLRIAKVNSDGSIQDQRSFEFTNGTDAGLQWSDFDTMVYKKDIVDNVDYTMLKTAIEEFARGQSGAYAYGGLYMDRYQQSSLGNRINAIMDKLGIERQQNNSNFQRSNNGFFSNNNGSDTTSSGSSEHKSFSQISSMLDGDDDED